jgi:hypothetical protein
MVERPASAVCAAEMPSLALRMATVMPRDWEVMFSAMARPAASSLALLTRRPEDRRCKAVLRSPCEAFRLRWAFSEATLVLMTCGISFSLGEKLIESAQALAGPAA